MKPIRGVNKGSKMKPIRGVNKGSKISPIKKGGSEGIDALVSVLTLGMLSPPSAGSKKKERKKDNK